MALVDIHVKKPREAQIWNCCTGNPVLRILPDSNKNKYGSKFYAAISHDLTSLLPNYKWIVRTEHPLL